MLPRSSSSLRDFSDDPGALRAMVAAATQLLESSENNSVARVPRARGISDTNSDRRSIGNDSTNAAKIPAFGERGLLTILRGKIGLPMESIGTRSSRLRMTEIIQSKRKARRLIRRRMRNSSSRQTMRSCRMFLARLKRRSIALYPMESRRRTKTNFSGHTFRSAHGVARRSSARFASCERVAQFAI